MKEKYTKGFDDKAYKASINKLYDEDNAKFEAEFNRKRDELNRKWQLVVDVDAFADKVIDVLPINIINKKFDSVYLPDKRCCITLIVKDKKSPIKKIDILHSAGGYSYWCYSLDKIAFCTDEEFENIPWLIQIKNVDNEVGSWSENKEVVLSQLINYVNEVVQIYKTASKKS